jgi:hypothetical protein
MGGFISGVKTTHWVSPGYSLPSGLLHIGKIPTPAREKGCPAPSGVLGSPFPIEGRKTGCPDGHWAKTTHYRLFNAPLKKMTLLWVNDHGIDSSNMEIPFLFLWNINQILLTIWN